MYSTPRSWRTNYHLKQIVSILHCLFAVCDAGRGCKFPQFLYQPPSGHGPRVWITELVYPRGSTIWESYINVTVNEHELLAERYLRGSCIDQQNCLTTEVLYSWRCLEVIRGKYRVRHTYLEPQGEQQILCVDFEMKNQNLVILRESHEYHSHGNDICQDYLTRNEWPWLAPDLAVWSKCPLQGGYDFRMHRPITRDETCDDFRPSRLESECVLGEGFSIKYISQACSPFRNKRQSMSLMCWADWEEEGYKFVIAGQPGDFPQFGFRTPPSLNGSLMDADMYFSPVAPLTNNGLPRVRHSIQHFHLKIRRSDPGVCYDESERCFQYSEEGMCSNNALYENANFCKKSCGLCNFFPSRKAECHFDDNIRGNWIMFENDRKASIQVTEEGVIKFSDLGDFVCKGKQWNRKDYKLFSFYRNGCRPRWSCLRMEALGTVGSLPSLVKAEFQISKSSLTDQSFTYCDHFEEDPPPIRGAVRSHVPKLIIRKDRAQFNFCGIDGRIEVRTEAGTCRGHLSDWNDNICGFEAKLKMSVEGNCGAVSKIAGGQTVEFSCDSFINLEPDYSLLMTRSLKNPDGYTCWVIQTYAERMSYRPWKKIYLLDRAQCGRAHELDYVTLKNSSRLILVVKGIPKKPCDQKTIAYTNRPRHGHTEYTDNQQLPGNSINPRPLHSGNHSPRTQAATWLHLLVSTVIALNT